MSAVFPHVTILGGGLLGGSLALALENGTTAPKVRLWARRKESADSARERGIAGATSDLAEAVAGADLVVLAVPVGSMPALVSRALEAGLPDGCLVTDVGSVKRAPHQTIPPLFAGRDIEFIGSHPMAGSERTGIAAINPRLFEQAACLLTNDEGVSQARAGALEEFWQGVGCRTAWMSAPIHDELVARISHLPHIVAASTARICIRDSKEGRFGGGGLRDTTRVASGNPEMWTEIVQENREAVAGPLRELIADLGALLGNLENGDHEATLRWLSEGKLQRDQLLSLG